MQNFEFLRENGTFERVQFFFYDEIIVPKNLLCL